MSRGLGDVYKRQVVQVVLHSSQKTFVKMVESVSTSDLKAKVHKAAEDAEKRLHQVADSSSADYLEMLKKMKFVTCSRNTERSQISH